MAIAAYLLLLWEKDESSKSKSFVDLGCGNGLLVYILTQEGHAGVGIDVRKRNIWDMYPPGVVLQVSYNYFHKENSQYLTNCLFYGIIMTVTGKNYYTYRYIIIS